MLYLSTTGEIRLQIKALGCCEQGPFCCRCSKTCTRSWLYLFQRSSFIPLRGVCSSNVGARFCYHISVRNAHSKSPEFKGVGVRWVWNCRLLPSVYYRIHQNVWVDEWKDDAKGGKRLWVILYVYRNGESGRCVWIVCVGKSVLKGTVPEFYVFATDRIEECWI